MSTTAGARVVPQPPGSQAQPMLSGAQEEQAGGLSLPAATALVIAGRIPQPADLPDDTAAKAPAAAGPSPGGPDGHAPTATGKPLPSRPEALKRQVVR